MTDYKLASRRNFDRQAAQYDTASFGRHARALYPVLLAQLAQIPHRSVLDVGCDSFHHYPDPRAALAEIRRVLQPGGVLLLGDTTAPAGLLRAINLLLPLSRGGDVRLYGPSELTALLEEFFHGAVCRRIHSTSLLAWGIK